MTEEKEFHRHVKFDISQASRRGLSNTFMGHRVGLFETYYYFGGGFDYVFYTYKKDK